MQRYTLVTTTQYKKDYKRCEKRGWRMELLDGVVAKLCRGETLDDRFYDHPLGGNYGGCRECHIRNDWILVYEILENDLYLKALQTGTHDDVFGR